MYITYRLHELSYWHPRIFQLKYVFETTKKVFFEMEDCLAIMEQTLT